jgi:ribosome-binding factor A
VARRRRSGAVRSYPRAARVNEVLREVVAEELERRSQLDDRLELLTVTAVEVEADLRRARVLFAELEDEAARAVAGYRGQLQEAISRQVRLKRTPQLSFEVDPAVTHGRRVDDILRHLAGDPNPGAEEGGAEHLNPGVEGQA